MAEIESVALVVREVFVYRVTARGSNRGYRADDWGLDKPLWTGRLKITTKGSSLTVVLQDSNTGEVFAQCPINNDKEVNLAVEPVTDSSRYFVVRVVNEAGQHAFLGLGFAERADSFDFNVAIQDHFKREKKEAASKEPYTPKVDFSGFKEGQTIHISIKKKDSAGAAGAGGAAPAVGSIPAPASSGSLLPPPAAASLGLRAPPASLFPSQASPFTSSHSPFTSSSSSSTASFSSSFNPFASIPPPASAPAAAAPKNDFADWGDFSSAPSAGSGSAAAPSGDWVKF